MLRCLVEAVQQLFKATTSSLDFTTSKTTPNLQTGSRLAPFQTRTVLDVSDTTASTESFSRFADLPPEIRLQIGGLAANHGRVIEMDISCRRLFEVVQSSRKAPAVLHVNREAREEAGNFYTSRIFNADGKIGAQYINPLADIVLLGQAACFLAIRKLLAYQVRMGSGLSRVAIWPHRGVDPGCGHGTDFSSEEWLLGKVSEKGWRHGRALCCLRDVFFVVDTDLQIDEGAIHEHQVAYRKASRYGSCDVYAKIKRLSEVPEEYPMWAGNERPNFEVIYLPPVGYRETVCDFVQGDRDTSEALTINAMALTKGFEKIRGCKLTVHCMGFNKDEVWILGFSGGVEEAKKLILDLKVEKNGLIGS